MKKYWFMLMGVLLLVPVSAQVVYRPKAVLLTKSGPYNAGDTVRIVYGREQGTAPDRLRRKYSTSVAMIAEEDLRFVEPLEYWSKVWLLERAETLALGDAVPERRPMLLADDQTYQDALAEKGVLYEDALINDYLNRVAWEVHGQPKLPNRGFIKVLIVRSTTPDAFTLSDGTILLSMGLLSLIRTEDELRVILASQIAYLVMEYNLINYNREITNTNLRQALGIIAAVSVATLEVYSNYTYDTDFDGQSAVAAGIIVSSLTGNITRSIGAAYSREQVLRSQQIAQQYMREAGGDTMALGRLLMRMGTEKKLYGPQLAGENPSRYLPTLTEQFAQVGPVSGTPDPAAVRSYLLMMGELIREQAWTLFAQRQYEQAMAYTTYMLESGQENDETYLLAARLLRMTRNTPADNAESLRLAQAGLQMSYPEMSALLIEVYLLHMRMEAYPAAAETLERLLVMLNERLQVWPADTQAQAQIRWAQRMLQACQLLEAESLKR